LDWLVPCFTTVPRLHCRRSAVITVSIKAPASIGLPSLLPIALFHTGALIELVNVAPADVRYDELCGLADRCGRFRRMLPP